MKHKYPTFCDKKSDIHIIVYFIEKIKRKMQKNARRRKTPGGNNRGRRGASAHIEGLIRIKFLSLVVFDIINEFVFQDVEALSGRIQLLLGKTVATKHKTKLIGFDGEDDLSGSIAVYSVPCVGMEKTPFLSYCRQYTTFCPTDVQQSAETIVFLPIEQLYRMCYNIP